MILLYSKIHKYKEEFELSFINNALKTSAIACMTAITVATSVATVGGVIYGPKIARSVIDASSGVARASNLAGNVMLSADESVKILEQFAKRLLFQWRLFLLRLRLLPTK